MGVDTGTLDELSQRAGREVAEGHLPSAQIAVALNSEILFSQTYGADPNARYISFSCTKALTGAAVWRAIDTGLMRRDSRAVDLVPGLSDPSLTSITVEHLLTHTAGIPNAPMPEDAWQDPTLRTRAFETWRAEWEPGSRFVYHGRSAHWTLMAMLETVTGEDFREWVRSRVIEPLGLASMQLGTPAGDSKNVCEVEAVGQPGANTEAMAGGLGLDISAVGGEVSELLIHNDPAIRAVGQPAGGAISTATDWAMFYQALLNNPGGLWSPAILRAGTQTILCDLPDPMTSVPAHRTLGLLVAGDDGNAMMRGFGRSVSGRAFGHMGAGGQIAWADPASGLSLCWLTNGLDCDPMRMGIRSDEISTLAGRLVGA